MRCLPTLPNRPQFSKSTAPDLENNDTSFHEKDPPRGSSTADDLEPSHTSYTEVPFNYKAKKDRKIRPG